MTFVALFILWYVSGIVCVSILEYQTFGTTSELWKQQPLIILAIAVLGPLLIYPIFARKERD